LSGERILLPTALIPLFISLIVFIVIDLDRLSKSTESLYSPI